MLEESSKKRYEAFWNNEAYEHAAAYITCWKPGAEPFETVELARQWEDTEYRAARAVYEAENTFYFGDGFASYFVNYGPGSLAACIGGSYRWQEETVWFENEQVIDQWENPPEPVLHENSKMYRMIDDLTQAMLKHKNRLVISISDIGGIFDIMASLRRTQDLLMDLLEYPNEIKAYARKVCQAWKTYFLRYSNLLLQEQGCLSTWMPIYSEKSYFPIQCDFSAMISPDMFFEFVLPTLVEQTEFMDRSIYHLDGVGEIPHVDHLLSIPRLNAIQWTAGEGKAPLTDETWFELYQKIQAGGKGLILLGAEPEGIEHLLKHIKTKGLYLSVNAKDPQQAKECLRIIQLAGVKS